MLTESDLSGLYMSAGATEKETLIMGAGTYALRLKFKALNGYWDAGSRHWAIPMAPVELQLKIKPTLRVLPSWLKGDVDAIVKTVPSEMGRDSELLVYAATKWPSRLGVGILCHYNGRPEYNAIWERVFALLTQCGIRYDIKRKDD